MVADLSTVVTLATAFGAGGITAVVLRSRHEREERRRDRMLAVAEEFLRAAQDAYGSANEAHKTVSEYDPTAPSEDRLLAARAGMEALNAAQKAIDAASAVVPRLTLVFPSAKLEEGQLVPAHRLVVSLLNLTGMLSFGLSNPPLQRELLAQQHHEVGREFGLFTGYANRTIWRRWHTRLTTAIREETRRILRRG